MTETAPQAPIPEHYECWHVDFHMSYTPSDLTPLYMRCDVARREPGDGDQRWHHQGVASFEPPSLVIPRAGAELVPYLIYHLNLLKDWLTGEHTSRILTGIEDPIGDDIGVRNPPAGSVAVYSE